MPIEEDEANLALLQGELSAIQNGIRGLDAILFQVKGWCVTATLAIAALAVNFEKISFLFLGIGAATGFWLVDTQFKLFQRAFISKNQQIALEIQSSGVLALLRRGNEPGHLEFGTTQLPWPDASDSYGAKLLNYAKRIRGEAFAPSNASLYLLVIAGQLVVMILLVSGAVTRTSPTTPNPSPGTNPSERPSPTSNR